MIALPVAIVGSRFQETYDQMESEKIINATREALPKEAKQPGYLSDLEKMVFEEVITNLHGLNTNDTDFFMKCKKTQRLIDQDIAASDMVHKLERFEKVRRSRLHFTYQKIIMKFLADQ